MKKHKILHILNSVGGVDVSLRLIVENIDNSKFENVIIHGKEDTSREFKDKSNNNLKEYKLAIQRNISIIKDIKVLIDTFKIIKKENPDIIHAHSAKGGIIAKAVGAFFNKPILHTPQAYSYLSAESKTKKKVFLLIETFFSKFNNKILASSTSEMNRATQDVGYLKKDVLLFNNSIRPIDKLSPISITKNWPDNYICSVGRPSYQKNIELMLKVLKKAKNTKQDIHLVLMGVGFHSPNLENVKRLIADYNLEDNITLLDWTEREDIFNIISNSQLYLTTARYEGLPYSVIESLALGKAIVATDADGNRDLVKNNYNGRLVYNENVNDLASAIIDILKDESLNREYSSNSKKLFNENFNVFKNIKNLEKIYSQEILKQ